MPRLSKAERDRIREQIPPKRCSGTSKQSGGPCKNKASVGHEVCHIHGAKSPQAIRKAEERIALAQALVDFKDTEPRNPWEVLQDIGHTADVLYQHAKMDIQGQPYTPALLDVLKEAMSRAANLAKMNLDARGDERRISLKERQAEHIQGIFVRILTGLDLTPTQQALLPALVKRELGPHMPPMIEGQAA